MRCPHCDFEQQESESCQACGLVFAIAAQDVWQEFNLEVGD